MFGGKDRHFFPRFLLIAHFSSLRFCSSEYSVMVSIVFSTLDATVFQHFSELEEGLDWLVR